MVSVITVLKLQCQDYSFAVQPYRVVNEAQSLKNSIAGQYVTVTDLPTETLKMATACLATGPIVLLYPFVQKYFIGGITVGAVKG